MFTRNKSEASRRERDGLVSHILLEKGDVPGGELTVTWVDVAPGSAQSSHKHAPEQVYVVVRGRGLMRVGDEERPVAEGDLVYIPSNMAAATPNVDWQAFYDTGPLRARSENERECADT